jgi:hypothetical protein
MKTAWRRVGVCGCVGICLLLAPLTRAQALVGTGDIANLAVTNPKLANSAVNAAKLATNAVTSAKIAKYAVTAAKLAANSVTADKIAFYSRVIVVAPSGGDFTSPVAAMNSIVDASESKTYLVKIMPGVYDIGSGTVQMKPWVDIEGSGPGITSIVGTQNTCDENPDVAGDWRPRYGVVTASGFSELRSLSVGNNGASTEACAVTAILAADCEGLRITRVGAQARGTNINVAMMVRTTTELEPVWLADSEAYAEGGAMSIGIILRGKTATASDPVNLAAVVTNTLAEARDATGYNIGMYIADSVGFVSGGFASAEQAVIVDGGSAMIQGVLLFGSVVVKDNIARPTPSIIANSTVMEAGTLTVNNGTLSVTNSPLTGLSVSLLNNPTVTLLNSSVGLVTMDSGTFKAANSSLGGAASVTGGTAICASATRTDSFLNLDGTCQ